MTETVPTIANSLEEDLAVLLELEEQLPEVGSQIRDIRKVYDRGRDKASHHLPHTPSRTLTRYRNAQAKEFMSSLEWLNTPVSLRLRTIIFTPNAPVSKKWKILVVSVSAWMPARGRPDNDSCSALSSRSSSARACGLCGLHFAGLFALTKNGLFGVGGS